MTTRREDNPITRMQLACAIQYTHKLLALNYPEGHTEVPILQTRYLKTVEENGFPSDVYVIVDSHGEEYAAVTISLDGMYQYVVAGG